MNEALENRNAVSTLVDALGSIAMMDQTSPVSSVAEKENGQVVKRHEATTTRQQSSRVHLGTAQSVAAVANRRTRVDTLAGSKNTPHVSGTQHFQAHPSASAEFAPQVLHASQGSNAAQGGAVSSGVSSAAQPSPGPLTGNASSPAQATQPTALAANNSSDDIRPMTLAPTPDDGSASSQTLMSPTFSGGSGGGPPPDKAPILTASGGSWGGTLKKDPVTHQDIPGQYEVVHGAPVGSVAMLKVLNPDPSYVIDTTTIVWANGTDVSWYFDDDPALAPPETLAVTSDVATDELEYVFVIDAKARDYHVTVNVTYTNDATGTATLDFTSVRPAVATLAADTDPTPTLRTGDPGVVWYWDENAEGGATGMVLKADTEASQYFGGDFMIMQIAAHVDRTYVDSNNVPHPMAGDGLIDDGGFGLTLGMEIVDLRTSWHLTSQNDDPKPAPNANPNDPPPPRTSIESSSITQVADDVSVPTPHPTTDKKLTVGYPGPNPPNSNDPPVPEKYKTYLMYKPDGGGVWVALAKVEWGWGIHIENQAGVWQIVADTTQDLTPAPTNPIPPEDEDFWPVWDGKTSDLVKLWPQPPQP